MTKNILFISSKAIDENVIAAIRLQRIMRYLGQHGWDVYCLCPRIVSDPFRSEQNIRVIALSLIVSGDSFWAKVSRKLIYPTFGAFVVLWLYYRHRISRVVATIPEIEALMIGAKARRLLGSRITLIAEIRDPFSLNAAHPWGPAKRKFYQWVEGMLMRWPDRMIFLTPAIQEIYLSQFKEAAWQKSHRVIMNGFDPADFQGQSTLSTGPLILTHVGTFYGERHPLNFLSTLKQSTPSMKEPFKVIFAGEAFGPDLNRKIQISLADPLISAHVEWKGPCKHEEALRLMQMADVNFLITHTQGSDYAIPGKLFEYIGAGKPILAFTQDPLVIQLIEENHLGWVCRNTAELRQWFISILNTPNAIRSFLIPKAVRARFSLEERMREFEEVL